jgi:2-polyprenyl-3-methyl-5-hydroxy-6-metoxy-1,4-benzoquinol methylase
MRDRREKWSGLWKFIDLYRIKYALKYVEGGNVLDLGAGDAIEFISKEKYGYYHGIDLDEKLMDYLRKKCPDCDFSVVDFEIDTLNLNSKFDTILILAVIEHVHNAKNILEECHRYLKDSGKLVITTPTKRGDRLLKILVKLFGSKEKEDSRPHCMIYDHKSLESVLKNACFGVCVQEVPVWDEPDSCG